LKPAIVSILVHFYRVLLRLYPTGFQDEFGAEMEEVFATAVTDASQANLFRVTLICLEELADFPANLAEAYRLYAVQQEAAVMNREVRWSVWPVWVILNLLSIPLAVLLAMVLVVLADRIGAPLLQASGPAAAVGLEPILLISMLILATAVLQWLLLRRYLHHARVWVPLTALGWLVGMLLIYLVGLFELPVPGAWIPALVPPFLGAVVGVTQWLYLRQVIDKAGFWVLASAVGYGMLARGAFGSFTSIPEFLFFILAPFTITGLALFLLLRQGGRGQQTGDRVQREDDVDHAPWLRRLAIILLGGLLLIPLFFAGTWVYASGQLTLAKGKGIYATAEEGMRSKLLQQAWDLEPEPQVEIVHAGPNKHDGSQPHVWFVGAQVRADHRPSGKSTAPRGYYSGGSFFLRVQEGWVHVPEGAFPQFIGWAMTLYGLEGA